MLKKVGKILRFLLVGIVWTFIYVRFANLFIYSTWNFDFLNTNHWKIIGTFWDNGGAISSLKDYMFMLSLALIIPIWIAGFYFFYKVNYINILLFPILWHNNRMIRKYGQNAKRITLKNMGVAQKIDINELVEERLQKEQPAQSTNVSEIRQAIQEKINKAKK